MSMPDGIGAVVLAALVLQYLRRFLNTQIRMPDWDQVLKRVWPIAGVLIGVLVLLNIEQASTIWLWLAVGAIISYTVWRAWDYRPARTIALAIAPLIVITIISKLIRLIASGFHKASKDYLDAGVGFAFIWLFTFAVIASRQKKTVEKEWVEREQEAEKRRLVEFQNAELERMVAQRTAEITSQKEELERAIAELKTTQTQLIQSEKMASLGELTAGIAHEIQNPLNFVNNFSEVSVELIDELTDEQQKPNRDAELEAELLADLKQNLQKITQHGSRASSIVRGMLQHSRANAGQREPTDLNALCDEYLRLAYHGLRAKDKTFNAHFSADLDESLGLVSVVPQDFGRVLLNLFTNAFYAVQQRAKNGPLNQQGLQKDRDGGPLISLGNYQPAVRVQTQCTDGLAQIRVIDNGTGMSEAVKAKIFQPFFTTKPTGEGTGLGLSLAYDIIIKGHGGTLSVESREGEGTEFIIRLPA